MKEYVKPIDDEMVNELARGQQAEVRDFVEFLFRLVTNYDDTNSA